MARKSKLSINNLTVYCEPDRPGIPAEWLEFMTPYSYEKFATVAPFYLEDRFECGWPIENTIYRTSLLLVALINSALSLIAHLADVSCDSVDPK